MSRTPVSDAAETRTIAAGAAPGTAEEPLKAEVLWTGGWDSTFRVLTLVLVRRVQVQPHYIVDPGRPSRMLEMAAMECVRRDVIAQWPEAEWLLLPHRLTPLEEIAPNEAITKAFENVTQRRFLGRQYEWLARYVHHRAIDDLELCMQKDDNCYRAVQNFLRARQWNGETVHELDPQGPSSPESKLFGRFRFPLAEWTKPKMQEAAVEGGFFEYLDKSWSCYHPGKDGRPCGTCNPCVYAMQEGLAWRFPRSSRLRYYLSIKRRAKSVLRRRPGAYKFLKEILAFSR